jgi:hypothetical protein
MIAGQPFTTPLDDAPAGILAALTAELRDSADDVVIAATSAGVAQFTAHSYTWTAVAPLIPGGYEVVWYHSGAEVGRTTITVTAAAPAALGANLISWEYVKEALGHTDNAEQDKYEQAIEDASAAIRAYTDRDFATADETETRDYRYGGDGFLEVDDIRAGSITEVRIDNAPLGSGTYLAEPTNGPVYTWLELPARAHSPEMGFTRNEDKYVERFGRAPAVVSVTATFGWPEVPADVRRAALWTVMAFADNPNATISESIGTYSRTVANPNTAAIPSRAKDILDAYRRYKL